MQNVSIPVPATKPVRPNANNCPEKALPSEEKRSLSLRIEVFNLSNDIRMLATRLVECSSSWIWNGESVQNKLVICSFGI